MNRPKEIYVHCTATPEGVDFDADDVRGWHIAPKSRGGRGWIDNGYHSVIKLDGTDEPGRDLDRDGDVEEHVGAHAYGHNQDSLAVVYVGGVDEDNRPKDTRTAAQKEALISRVLLWMRKYNIPVEKVKGHYEVDPKKACPSFAMEPFRAELRSRLSQTSPQGPLPFLFFGPFPLVSRKSQGFEVAVLQHLLAGHQNRPVRVTGVMSDSDFAAVINYQKANGLTPDGLVGQETWSNLLGISGTIQVSG
jgi:hypothetical protein